jgi:hypothetical protein
MAVPVCSGGELTLSQEEVMESLALVASPVKGMEFGVRQKVRRDGDSCKLDTLHRTSIKEN